ncbi:MAG: hypothetical protein J0H54_08505 [Rhizobiales bacterium]|nr:hypothetical protein [Hyphomicrobiales bacterium]
MTIALPKQWIWDFWITRDGGLWHAYFLKADKSLGDPELRHRNVTQGHAVSTDLVNWLHLGTCFAPSPTKAWDDWTTWTGSVLRGPDGTAHLFYTGTSREGDGLHQRIGHATSFDMHSWQRVGDGLALDLSGPDYEEYHPDLWPDRAFRDPWVIRDPNGDGWLMFFTARVPGRAEPNAGGAIGFATSPDLYHWTIRPPVFAGGLFGQMEVPQVIEIEGRWYCFFCTWSHHWSSTYRQINPQAPVGGTHYLMADNPRGPWRVAPGPFLDGATPVRRYAGRIVRTGQGPMLMGFVHTTPEDEFVGEVSDPIALDVAADGTLKRR